jgi:hypothetical protein
VGKLGVIGYFLSLVVIVPSLLAYVLGLLFSLDITIVRDTLPLLFSCLVYGALIVLSAGTLMLALSSLSRNSRYVALFWVVLWFVSSIVAGILQDMARHQRSMEVNRQHNVAMQPFRQPHQKPLTFKEQQAHQEALMEAFNKGQARVERAELEALQTDWRPMLSYTGNLSRLGNRLLKTDAAWTKLSELLPAGNRDNFLVRRLAPQHPWHWSAGILAILFGLSACILNLRIRSLDRLR